MHAASGGKKRRIASPRDFRRIRAANFVFDRKTKRLLLIWQIPTEKTKQRNRNAQARYTVPSGGIEGSDDPEDDRGYAANANDTFLDRPLVEGEWFTPAAWNAARRELAEEAGLLENVELMVLDKFVEQDTVIFISMMDNLENMYWRKDNSWFEQRKNKADITSFAFVDLSHFAMSQPLERIPMFDNVKSVLMKLLQNPTAFPVGPSPATLPPLRLPEILICEMHIGEKDPRYRQNRQLDGATGDVMDDHRWCGWNDADEWILLNRRMQEEIGGGVIWVAGEKHSLTNNDEYFYAKLLKFLQAHIWRPYFRGAQEIKDALAEVARRWPSVLDQWGLSRQDALRLTL